MVMISGKRDLIPIVQNGSHKSLSIMLLDPVLDFLNQAISVKRNGVCVINISEIQFLQIFCLAIFRQAG